MDLAMLIMVIVTAVLGTAVIYRCWKVEKDTEYLDDIHEKGEV